MEKSRCMTKMYILIRSDVDAGMAVVAAAHASLSGYLHFVEQESRARSFNHSSTDVCPDCGQLNPDYPTDTQKWAAESFRKVVCSVTEEQFQEAKSYGVAGVDYRVMTESSLEGAEVAIVFKPRENWEPFFKGLPLWGKGFCLMQEGLSVPAASAQG